MSLWSYPICMWEVVSSTKNPVQKQLIVSLQKQWQNESNWPTFIGEDQELTESILAMSRQVEPFPH